MGFFKIFSAAATAAVTTLQNYVQKQNMAVKSMQINWRFEKLQK